ncbi:unnamed protein product [Durusdinium trenchii]|uniref:Ubiquitin-like domain-containing protein n=1 Tax=Durusdinium trenchii TaxID=1381693 RepID=A0ABP0LF44_9DINO
MAGHVETMKVSILLMSGEVIVIDVMPDIEISNFKSQLKALQPEEDQVSKVTTVELIIDGQKVDDKNKILRETGISPSSQVHVMFLSHMVECYSKATSGCNVTNLYAVSIPDTATGIEDFAFKGCVHLANVTIPSSVTIIGKHAFSGCALTSLRIPNSVISIQDFAFTQCTALSNVIIPSSVASIGKSVFLWLQLFGQLVNLWFHDSYRRRLLFRLLRIGRIDNP